MNKTSLLEYARNLTGEQDIDKLIHAAQKLQQYFADPVISHTNSIHDFASMLQINNPCRGSIPFIPRGYQQDLLTRFELNQNVIITHDRQLGITTTLAAYAAYRLHYYSDQTILIVHPTFNQLKCNINIIQDMIRHFPPGVFPTICTNTATNIKLNNGSMIFGATASGKSGLGTAIDLLIIDNAAFISYSKQQEFWHSIMPSLKTSNSQIIVASADTPDKTGLFYDLQKSDQFVNVKLPWYVDPTRIGPM